MERRTGMKIGALKSTAWRQGWLSDDDLRQRAATLEKSGYGHCLHGLLERGPR